MSNMSYCRFQNTLQDLRDCHENMDDDLNGEEKRARLALIKLCTAIATEYCEFDIKTDSKGEMK